MPRSHARLGSWPPKREAHRWLRRTVGISLALPLGVIPGALSARGQQSAPQAASQTPAEAYSPAQVQAGQPLFTARCGFCHGRDTYGGESGPDLSRSTLVTQDVRGDKIIPVIRDGRVDKGMPAISLPDRDMAAIVAYIHDQKKKSELPGRRRSVDPSDLRTGNANAGKEYFYGAGGCARCHAPDGDLAGIGGRLEGLTLLQRMLDPASGRRDRPNPATVTVTTRAGETISGRLAYRDEFTIALTDTSGWYRSWPTNQVTFTVNNPLDAHGEQLGKYTDSDMHNVLAYLQTLR
jgi:cytochrome c oxidase cbb3-type subunit 3